MVETERIKVKLSKNKKDSIEAKETLQSGKKGRVFQYDKIICGMNCEKCLDDGKIRKLDCEKIGIIYDAEIMEGNKVKILNKQTQ